MKQNKYNLKLKLILSFLLLVSSLMPEILYSQTISVSGRITYSRISVKSALVTFIDNSNPTNKLSAITDESGNYTLKIKTSTTSIKNALPSKFELEQNYPNPFTSATALPYSLNERSDVRITIYDILGNEVRKFEVSGQPAGSYNVLWNGQHNLGYKVAAGVYFYRLEAKGESFVKKMIFNKTGKDLFLLPQSFTSAKRTVKGNGVETAMANNFTIRIENSDSTYPAVTAKEIQNVTLLNDTTISVSVECIPTAKVNFDSLHQIIRGFGASNVLLWRPDMTSSEVEAGFGAGDGQIGFSILRIMLESDSSRWKLYLSTVKKAQSLGATIIAAPWFAPSSMVETVSGRSRVRYDSYGKYAEHLNSFITYMKNNGVNVYGISVQNEPDITDQWTSFSPEEMLNFMKNYAGSIQGAYVMAPESFQFKKNMSDPILNDSLACANTDIVCGHLYGAGLEQYPLAISKRKEVWMTEYLFGEQNSANNWSWAFKVATNMNDVMKADMSAYVWWNIVRYYGPIGDGEKSTQNPNESYPRKGEVSKKGYVMSQFSRFIRPGYFRVENSLLPASSSGGVDVTVYKDPVTSKKILVAVNSNTISTGIAFRLSNVKNIVFTPYTTSETNNCAKQSDITTSNGSFIYTLEPMSITTFVGK